jgi:hypothetical protein
MSLRSYTGEMRGGWGAFRRGCVAAFSLGALIFAGASPSLAAPSRQTCTEAIITIFPGDSVESMECLPLPGSDDK